MSQGNDNRYDEYACLFTNDENDRRSSLFLSELRKHADNERIKSSDSDFKSSHLRLQNPNPCEVTFFDSKHQLNDLDLHPEWPAFLASVAYNRNKLNSKSITPPVVAKKILDIIKRVGMAASGSLDQLVRILLQTKLLKSVSGPAVSVAIGNHSEWASATEFVFADDILASLLIIFTKFPTNIVSDPCTPLTLNGGLSVLNRTFVRSGASGKQIDFSVTEFSRLRHVFPTYPSEIVSWPVTSSVKKSDDDSYNKGSGATPNNILTAWTNLANDLNNDIGKTAGSPLSVAGLALANKISQELSKLLAKTTFGYKFTKYLINRVLGEAANAPSPTTVSSFFSRDDDTTPQSNQYFRGSDFLLYERTSTGNVLVEFNSPAVQNLSVKDKCLGTNVEADDKMCSQYLQDCLQGKDVEKCKTYLTNLNFWNTAQDEINKMQPLVAVQTLRAFQFVTEEKFVPAANMSLDMVENWNSWLQGLNKQVASGKLTQPDVDAITKNTKLQGYLEALVTKVNSNPGILNKNYLGEKLDVSNQLFKGTQLSKYGLTAARASSNMSPAQMERLRINSEDARNRFGVTIGLPNSAGLTWKFALSGGSSISNQVYLDETNKQQHSVLTNQYTSLVQRLAAHKKSVAPEDDKKIIAMLTSLKQNELSLHKIMLMTEKYSELLNEHGQRDSAGVLSVDHLEAFVEQRKKYFERVSRKQSDLISIIKSIAEALNKETPDNSNTKRNTKPL